MNLAVVGTGYVGLVTAACFAEMGNDVICIDINPAIIDNLQKGQIHIHEPGLEPLVKRNSEEGRLQFTTDLGEGIANALFILNCVGTPPKDDGSCDLSFVNDVAGQIGDVIT
ncbi:MAG: UDP-glucose/GDP-mannose dehydrogenase family protein, partial [Desulfosarcina sp.]|nr:UDP-glucose/GDP-mannose dehydrogenase family protein [Desulfobacterales bacterium]